MSTDLNLLPADVKRAAFELSDDEFVLVAELITDLITPDIDLLVAREWQNINDTDGYLETMLFLKALEKHVRKTTLSQVLDKIRMATFGTSEQTVRRRGSTPSTQERHSASPQMFSRDGVHT